MGAKKLNKKTQIRHLEANLRKAKIDPDLIDLEALVDSDLSYTENKKNVFDQVAYAIEHKKISVSEEAANTFFQIKMVQEQRGYAGKYDEKRKNKHLITEKSINRNPSKADKWFKNPGKYDIEGIDDDKTAGRSIQPPQLPQTIPITPKMGEAVPVVSNSQILKEINLNGEFETMAEKINSKAKDDDKKYEHSCGAKFNEKLKFCPGCGDELEV